MLTQKTALHAMHIASLKWRERRQLIHCELTSTFSGNPLGRLHNWMSIWLFWCHWSGRMPLFLSQLLKYALNLWAEVPREVFCCKKSSGRFSGTHRLCYSPCSCVFSKGWGGWRSVAICLAGKLLINVREQPITAMNSQLIVISASCKTGGKRQEVGKASATDEIDLFIAGKEMLSWKTCCEDV